MIRFIMTLLGRHYEPCKSCETLREQLAYERGNNSHLTQTIISLARPSSIPQPVPSISGSTNIKLPQPFTRLSQRRAEAEQADREVGNKAIDKLESDLGIAKGE